MRGITRILALTLALCLGAPAAAQGTLAKLKFEDAEKAYLAKDYTGSLARLKELEDQGLKNPRVLHLKILATNALLSERTQRELQAKASHPPETYAQRFDEMLAFKADVEHYLQHYDIAGLEDKFRDVYRVAEQRRQLFDEGVHAAFVASRHFDKRQYPQAMQWYGRALQAGGFERDMRRQGWYFQLGYLHASGQGTARDPKAAAGWYTKAVELGSTASMNNLALLYRSGEGVDQDVGRAIELFTRAAQAGNVRAASNLATTYEQARYGRQDAAQAVAWYTKAAEGGDAFAMGRLATAYSRGLGVAPDDAQAVAWQTKAAQAGRADAAVELGDWHLLGLHGLKPDAKAAHGWYAKAPASERLAIALYEGLGGTADPVAARAILEKPAGIERAFNLALLQFAGKGMAKDEAAAAEQFLARHGDYFTTPQGAWAADFKAALAPGQGRLGRGFPGYAADALGFIAYLNRAGGIVW